VQDEDPAERRDGRRGRRYLPLITEMETATQEMRVCMGRDGAGQEDGPTGEGGLRQKEMGRDNHGDQVSRQQVVSCPAWGFKGSSIW